jgi:hypothetical protein
LIAHKGRGLTPRQLRFWGLTYDLPVEQVNKWVQNARSGIWTRDEIFGGIHQVNGTKPEPSVH